MYTFFFFRVVAGHGYPFEIYRLICWGSSYTVTSSLRGSEAEKQENIPMISTYQYKGIHSSLPGVSALQQDIQYNIRSRNFGCKSSNPRDHLNDARDRTWYGSVQLSCTKVCQGKIRQNLNMDIPKGLQDQVFIGIVLQFARPARAPWTNY